MSSIKIFDLSPIGSQLFQDSESFLDELTDPELGGIEGGLFVFNRRLSRWTIRTIRVVSKFRSRVVRGNIFAITYTAKTIVSAD